MSGKRTKVGDPIVAKARDMRARGKSYAVIARVCGKDSNWAKYWSNEDIRQNKIKYKAARQ